MSDFVKARPSGLIWQLTRPSVIALVMCALIFVICLTLLKIPLKEVSDLRMLGVKTPHPGLSARDVVEIQVRGLKSIGGNELGAFQCYCFAAPSNRIVTGPFARFSQLVTLPPYDHLCRNRSFVVGREVPMGQLRRVLVTTVGHDRVMRLYMFVLEKQAVAPFEECWMTTGVFVLQSPPPSEPTIEA